MANRGSRLNAPLVSVVVPTTGRLNLLDRAVTSALEQGDVALEVVVVVDGDPAAEARVRRFLASRGDSRLRTVSTGARGGVARARNLGVAEARAPWTAFLDDDDFWAPRKLAAQLAVAEEADAGFVYTATLVVDDRLRPLRFREAPDPRSLARSLPRGNSIGSPSTVLARTDLLRGQGFDPRFSTLADWELWLRIVGSTRAAARAEPLVAYVYHDDNMHLTQGAWSLLGELRALSRLHRRRDGAEPVKAGRLLVWLAERYWSAGRRGRSVAVQALAAVIERELRPSGARVIARLRRGGERAPIPPPAPPEWLRRFQDELRS